MLNPRIIPVLQMNDGRLVKTVRFRNPNYVGDPLNAVRIFNEKKVDELIIVDISPGRKSTGVNLTLLERIFSECDMPVTYGGGILNYEMASSVLKLGCEKLLFNTLFFEDVHSIAKIAENFGSQAVSISLDYKYSFLGGLRFYKNSGREKTRYSLNGIIQNFGDAKAGEIILNFIDNDGTFKGYDFGLLKELRNKLTVPIILLGGCNPNDTSSFALMKGADSLAASSRFIFQGPHKAVLIQYDRF